MQGCFLPQNNGKYGKFTCEIKDYSKTINIKFKYQPK